MIRIILLASTLGLFFTLDGCQMDKVVKQAKDSSLFWKVTGNGLENPSYLYGTIHIQDEKVFNYGDTVNRVIKEVDIIAVEILLDRIDPNTLMSIMFMKDTELTDLMTEGEFESLDKAYKEITGASLETALNVKPFFISANMMNALVPKDRNVPLDLFFIQKGRELGKDVFGLETLSEQIAIIDKLSYKEQMKMLLESIKDIGKFKEQFSDLMAAYLSMDGEALVKLFDDPSIPEEFMDNMLRKRNELMFKRMIPHFKKGSTFVAVGAAHLFGDDGLVKMLKDNGYTVDPIPFEFKETEK